MREGGRRKRGVAGDGRKGEDGGKTEGGGREKNGGKRMKERREGGRIIMKASDCTLHVPHLPSLTSIHNLICKHNL